MFYSQELLIKKSGKKGVDRPQYLKELVEEFKTTSSKDSQEQVLANLANFAYDPFNYQWLHELGIIDIFIEQLSEESNLLQQFAIAGICNLALNSKSRSLILRKGGIPHIIALLTSINEICVIHSITTLIFLFTKETKHEILNDFVIEKMEELSKSENPRIKNLATIFLSDCH